MNYSTRPAELDGLSKENLAGLLVNSQTLGFYYLFDYENTQQKLEQILNQLLSCSYFNDSWRSIIIELIDWLDMWAHSIDPIFSPNLLVIVSEIIYLIQSMNSVNPINP